MSERPPITFTITREALLVHFLDRALFYRDEAIKIRDNVTQLGKRTKYFPGSEMAAEDQKQLALDFATGQSKAFQFMADHLADSPEFEVTLQEATQYELLTLQFLGQGVGMALAGRPVRGV